MNPSAFLVAASRTHEYDWVVLPAQILADERGSALQQLPTKVSDEINIFQLNLLGKQLYCGAYVSHTLSETGEVLRDSSGRELRNICGCVYEYPKDSSSIVRDVDAARSDLNVSLRSFVDDTKGSGTNRMRSPLLALNSELEDSGKVETSTVQRGVLLDSGAAAVATANYLKARDFGARVSFYISLFALLASAICMLEVQIIRTNHNSLEAHLSRLENDAANSGHLQPIYPTYDPRRNFNLFLYPPEK